MTCIFRLYTTDANTVRHAVAMEQSALSAGYCTLGGTKRLLRENKKAPPSNGRSFEIVKEEAQSSDQFSAISAPVGNALSMVVAGVPLG